MTTAHLDTFRRLHQAGSPLLLANAWDAGSARLIESCGAKAIATTSAGLAWSRGYADGNALPPAVLAAAVAEIARVLSVPLTADVEGGYSDDPTTVGQTVAAVVGAGAVGINLEDGGGSPDLLCAKIAAVKAATAHVFVNARTDVYLRGLVPADRAVAETIARGRRYRDAGCDGLFVPLLTDPDAMRTIANEVPLPLNVMIVPHLPPVSALGGLGVRRVSAGAAIAQASYGLARRAATQLLAEGRYEAMFDGAVAYPEMNALFAAR